MCFPWFVHHTHSAMAVPEAKAHGGIVLTASHNPIAWNALAFKCWVSL